MSNKTFFQGIFAISILAAAAAHADPKKVLRFWNMAAATVIELYVSAPGAGNWSSNLCLSDQDHAVDPDERLALNGIEGGTYDVRVVDKDKRKCLFRSVTLRDQGPYAFSISEEQMKKCTQW